MSQYLRGFFWIGPAPYMRADRIYKRWARGQSHSCALILLSVPVSIFVAGFFAGRTF